MPRLPHLAVAAAVILASAPAAAQPDLSGIQVRATPVAEGVFMLVGGGGNLALSVGEDGAFLVDDQYAPMTERIRAAVAERTDRPVRFVVNTHWHGDHTGGNEAMGEAGAVVVAHENVRRRMSTRQFIEAYEMEVPPSPDGALPVVTFADGVTFHWNGDEIRVVHVDAAHTDGDAVVHFVGANVLHAGDVYFAGMYPLVDVSSGGSLDGMIDAVDRLLALADDETRVIPGHGPLSDRAGLAAYRTMLATSRERIGALVGQGMSRDAVIAAGPMRDHDEAWGGGYIQPDLWVGIVYDSLAADRDG